MLFFVWFFRHKSQLMMSLTVTYFPEISNSVIRKLQCNQVILLLSKLINAINIHIDWMITYKKHEVFYYLVVHNIYLVYSFTVTTYSICTSQIFRNSPMLCMCVCIFISSLFIKIKMNISICTKRTFSFSIRSRSIFVTKTWTSYVRGHYR